MIEARVRCAGGCCSIAARRGQPQGRAGDPRRAGPGRGLHPHGRADQPVHRRDRRPRRLGPSGSRRRSCGAGSAALLNFLPTSARCRWSACSRCSASGPNRRSSARIPRCATLACTRSNRTSFTPSILGARFTMNPVLILLALSLFHVDLGRTGALLSVPILLTLTALVRPSGQAEPGRLHVRRAAVRHQSARSLAKTGAAKSGSGPRLPGSGAISTGRTLGSSRVFPGRYRARVLGGEIPVEMPSSTALR